MSLKSEATGIWDLAPSKNFVYLAVFLNSISLLAIVLLRGFLPPVVPLFYGRPVDESQLVTILGLLIAPGVSFGILIINLVIAAKINDLFLKKVLVLSSFFVSLLVTITTFNIIFLVGLF